MWLGQSVKTIERHRDGAPLIQKASMFESARKNKIRMEEKMDSGQPLVSNGCIDPLRDISENIAQNHRRDTLKGRDESGGPTRQQVREKCAEPQCAQIGHGWKYIEIEYLRCWTTYLVLKSGQNPAVPAVGQTLWEEELPHRPTPRRTALKSAGQKKTDRPRDTSTGEKNAMYAWPLAYLRIGL